MNAPRTVDTFQRGILRAGRVLPGTDWVLRDPAAWWQLGERGVRRRTVGPKTLLCGHWTAGPPRVGPDSARITKRNMDARKDVEHLGVHFVIGWDGQVWQLCDLAHVAVHAGRAIDNRSVGVECTWPGTERQAATLRASGTMERRRVAGGVVRAMRPSAELLAAWVRLAETLAAAVPTIPRQVPLDRSGGLLTARLTSPQLGRWKGALEHFHAPHTSKSDAGGYLIEALRDAGWAGVSV